LAPGGRPGRRLAPPVGGLGQETANEPGANPGFHLRSAGGRRQGAETSETEIRVRWLKDGVALADGRHHHIDSYPDGTCSLIVAGVEEKDAGTYTCEVSNALGTTSHSAGLRVGRGGPWAGPEPRRDPARKPVRHLAGGYPISFDCMVGGYPPPTIRWFKDGKVLEENDHYMINEDQDGCHQLILTSVLLSDMGVYRCVAENYIGVSSTKAELRVDGKFAEQLSLWAMTRSAVNLLNNKIIIITILAFDTQRLITSTR
uniref:Obscurin, cytoskeletal calmodulin and titin-interacting RhoGEF b n=1 Tax=Callorhinchus milii TaxID=7868 RepID=A0A4W3HT79_CALMI